MQEKCTVYIVFFHQNSDVAITVIMLDDSHGQKLDIDTIARQSAFDLKDTRTADKRRMQTRMSTITCRTQASSRKRT